MYGEKGGGVAERDGVADRVDIIQGTLGKAFGLIGGYIASTELLVDYIRCFGRGFIFTTAMPPATAAGAVASVRLVRDGVQRRIKLHKNVSALKSKLREAKIPLLETPSHIIPVMVGDASKCRMASNILLERHGIFVQHINHPTVPVGTERLRITPTPLHTEEMMNVLVDALVEVFEELDLVVQDSNAA